jgi:hypothetical protein
MGTMELAQLGPINGNVDVPFDIPFDVSSSSHTSEPSSSADFEEQKAELLARLEVIETSFLLRRKTLPMSKICSDFARGLLTPSTTP